MLDSRFDNFWQRVTLSPLNFPIILSCDLIRRRQRVLGRNLERANCTYWSLSLPFLDLTVLPSILLDFLFYFSPLPLALYPSETTMNYKIADYLGILEIFSISDLTTHLRNSRSSRETGYIMEKCTNVVGTQRKIRASSLFSACNVRKVFEDVPS